ncbi:unnamed protein product [Peniophora sp. CBMAI 1063]|nr:unnamed protein product [Peniophora sp. CBMAI 1063]
MVDTEGLMKKAEGAAELTAVTESKRLDRLETHALSLSSRFERFGDLNDLSSAISIFSRSVELTSDDNHALSRRLYHYAQCLRVRFEHFGKFEDLGGALESINRSIQLTNQDEPPEVARRLCALGLLLLARFRRYFEALMTSFGDVDEALHAGRRAVALTHDDDPEVAQYLSLVSNCLLIRSQHFRNTDELREALTTSRRALELTPPDSFESATILGDVACFLLAQYNEHHIPADLENAVETSHRAVELAADNPLKLSELSATFGLVVWTRFKNKHNLGDLDDVIEAMTRSVRLTPEGHVELPMRLNRLALYSRTRFERFGRRVDLDTALEGDRRAVELTSAGDSTLAHRLLSLAASLQARFDHLGELNDVDSAIQAYDRALDDTPVNEYSLIYPQLMSGLATALRTRFERTGDLLDLERALDASFRSVELHHPEDPEVPRYLCNLAVCLTARFNQFQEPKDLEDAIDASHQSLALTPEGHTEQRWRMMGTAISLKARVEYKGELSDLDQSLQLVRRVIELTDDNDPYLPIPLHLLATLLRSRFESLRDVDDIESALKAHHEAIELSREDDPRLALYLHDIAVTLRVSHETIGDADDLERALRVERRSLKLTPHDHPEKSKRLFHEGSLLRTRFASNRVQQEFDAAVNCFMEASRHHQVGDSRWRFQSAEACIQLLVEHPEFSTSAVMLLAYSRVLECLPELLWLGYSARRRFVGSAQVGVLVNAAVSYAIEHSELERAVEWFDAGRALVWSQALSMRTSLVQLEQALPEHAQILKNDIYPELQRLGFHVHRDTASTHSAPDNEAYTGRAVVREDPSKPRSSRKLSAMEEYRRVAIAYDKLLKDVRSQEGFKDFMLPKKFQNLTSTSLFTNLHGAIVLINVDKARCDALILASDGSLKLVKLPGLTQQRAEQLCSIWVRYVGLNRGTRRGAVPPQHVTVNGGSNIYGRVLARLWAWVVQPVFDALDLTSKSHAAAQELPHIFWCTTGPLSRLPLHAAGVYDKGQTGHHAYDYAVSSYTPSLFSLLGCHDRVLEKPSPPTLLVVTQSNTPRSGLPPLPGVRDESNRLRTLFEAHGHWNSLLEGEDATRVRVLFTAYEHSWIHFACHGSQSSIDPTLSSIELYDSPLALYELTGSDFDNAELAFLSACETAVGDLKIPEQSAHLAAGMLAAGFKGVVATMWSIRDQDAPLIVEAYYQKLLELRGNNTVPKGETGAAYALHEAVKRLREKVGENHFERWVSFVHFGI